MSKMLSSWKEIAHYFGKGVRTVQRWEKTLALPIHRPPGAPSNVVLARTSDLDEWMHRGHADAGAAAEVIDEAGEEAALSTSLTALESQVAVLAKTLHTHICFVQGESSAPERIVAIKATISHLTNIASSAESKQAA